MYCEMCGDASVEKYCYYCKEEINQATDKVQLHEEISRKLTAMYKDKNTDYGDSYKKTRDKYPNAVAIRLTDKLSRLEVLLSGGTQQVKDESIDDTLEDMANYCIMELIERKLDNGGG